MVFLGTTFLGGPKAFVEWAAQHFQYADFRPPELYRALADEAYKHYIQTTQVL